MPDRHIVGIATHDAAPGQAVLVELIDEEDEDGIEYRVTAMGPPAEQGWSIAWFVVAFAFIIGLTIGGIWL